MEEDDVGSPEGKAEAMNRAQRRERGIGVKRARRARTKGGRTAKVGLAALASSGLVLKGGTLREGR